MRRRRMRLARAALILGGVALAAWLVSRAGVGRVLSVMNETWPWLPVVVALEAGLVWLDVLALRALLGAAAKEVPPSRWARSTLVAYASSVLLPAGRAAGEAARAATLAPSIGAARAAGACARLQACALLANAVISSIAIAAVASRWGAAPLLLPALAGNAAVCAVLAAALFALVGGGALPTRVRAILHRWVGRRAPPSSPPPARGQLVRAVFFCVSARVVQTLEYGVVLFAVGGAFAPASALAAQGAHLVGAAIGDVVPSQIGATEGAYCAFAGVLGLTEPARAVSIALLARAGQLVLVALSLLGGAVAYLSAAARREVSARRSRSSSIPRRPARRG